MGYRSEVGFVIAKKPGREIPDFNKVEPDFTFDSILENDEAVFYYCNHVKWYDNQTDYPLVNTVEEYLDSIEDDADYMFIRIGEDAEDLETKGNFWDNPFGFSYVRKIVFEE